MAIYLTEEIVSNRVNLTHNRLGRSVCYIDLLITLRNYFDIFFKLSLGLTCTVYMNILHMYGVRWSGG